MIENAYAVKHFKGKTYWVQGIVVNASNGFNNEKMILYVGEETHEMYVRPENEFWEEVTYQDKKVPRFAKIEEN